LFEIKFHLASTLIPAQSHRECIYMLIGERSDPYYRLNVFHVVAPPLRERREDIPLLVRHFANKYARRMGKKIESIPKETMDAFSRYAWPGNIGELQNLIERAVLLSSASSLRVPLSEIFTGLDEIAIAVATRGSKWSESKSCEHFEKPIGLSEALEERQLA
jgi:transcriptional regulator with PAS, ATPase and Fis domain